MMLRHILKTDIFKLRITCTNVIYESKKNYRVSAYKSGVYPLILKSFESGMNLVGSIRLKMVHIRLCIKMIHISDVKEA